MRGGIIINATIDTVFDCIVPLDIQPDNGTITVNCDTDASPGCTLMYRYGASAGCSYSIYDKQGSCINTTTFFSIEADGTRGGGFVIDSAMSRIVFSGSVQLSKTLHIPMSELISGVTSLDALQERITQYYLGEYRQDIINVYLDNKRFGTGSLPGTGSPGTGTDAPNTGTSGTIDLLSVYPLGAVYLSSIGINPAEFFGGVWQSIEGVFDSTVFAWTRIDESMSAIVDIAVADIAVCA